ncbi:MAG: GAF domain-containing sensor histidine kinase [Candidatus Latescibacterota bacterium]
MLEPIQRLFRKKNVSYRQALAEFSKSLTLIADMEQLKDNVAGKIREITGVRTIRIFLLNPDLNRFELAESRGDNSAGGGPHFSPEGPLVRWFAVNETWLAVQENSEVFSFLSGPEQTALREMDIRCIYPLFVMNRVSGLVCLGPKEREDRYETEEIELLNTLLGQAAFAFENAYLSEQQKTRLRRMYRADRLATLGQLAAGAAHEIRNPLTSIRSTIQYLRKELRDENTQTLVSDLIEEVDRINGIIEGLLSFSRPSEPQWEKCNLRQLLEQTISLVSTTAMKRNVAVTLDFLAPEQILKADPSQLKQVFLNIVMNAIQAMEGGGSLAITTDLKQAGDYGGKPRNSFRILFRDTGIGIPQSNIEHVFDPFFTTKRDGTGLGLSISYGIIRQHGGEIEIESITEADSPGHHGTTVKVILPAG